MFIISTGPHVFGPFFESGDPHQCWPRYKLVLFSSEKWVLKSLMRTFHPGAKTTCNFASPNSRLGDGSAADSSAVSHQVAEGESE